MYWPTTPDERRAPPLSAALTLPLSDVASQEGVGTGQGSELFTLHTRTATGACVEWTVYPTRFGQGPKAPAREEARGGAARTRMRCNKQAFAAVVWQALIKYKILTNAFGTADGATRVIRAIDVSASNIYTCCSRSTSAAARRASGGAVRGAAATAAYGRSSEKDFAAGGAEKIAKLLAGESGEGKVFYNRVGAINRDLSVLMANVLAEERAKERLAGKERERKRTPPAPGPSPDNDITHSEASLVDNMAQSGAARTRRRSRVGAFVNRALGRCLRGGWGRFKGDHGSATVLVANTKNMEQQEGFEVDEDGLIVLDAFAASGVRALRYLTEVPGIQRVVANDYDAAAIDMIRQAADCCGAGNKLEVHRGDALDTLYAARAGGRGTYDLIDIDPFGCAAGFLDASVQAVTDGGLLCVTSTDMLALSGAQPEVAWTRYGSVPTRSGYHHEMSLRILLHAISAAAGRYRRSIQPVLSVAIDHYVRVFVRVSRSPKAALTAAQESTSYVLQSDSCPSFFLLPILSPKQQSAQRGAKSWARRRPENLDPRLNEAESKRRTGGTTPGEAEQSLPLGLGGVCPETGGGLQAGGPIWSGPLHNKAWVTRAIAMASARETHLDSDEAGTLEAQAPGLMSRGVGVVGPRPRLAARARVESLLRSVSRELPDVPLFYNLRDMFATLGFRKHPRREQVMSALETAGYRTSGMHKEPLAVKTDAPDAAVWDVLRCWARDNPQPPPVRSAGVAILRRGVQLIADADFDAGQPGLGGRPERVARGRGGFLHTRNPEPHWGPLARRSSMARAENRRDGVEKQPEVVLPE